MPEELADFKAKGREWSRLYKEKRRKDFSLEQIEERKLKNRSFPLFRSLHALELLLLGSCLCNPHYWSSTASRCECPCVCDL